LNGLNKRVLKGPERGEEIEWRVERGVEKGGKGRGREGGMGVGGNGI
jgi:hypothetical protein